MRRPIGLWLVAVALGGCANLGDLVVPPPAMVPPRAARAGEEEASAARPGPAVREPAPAPAPAPARPAPAPPTTTAPPAAAPPPAVASPPAVAPPVAAPPAPATPAPPPRTAAIPREPPVLAPQATAEEEQRIKIQAERRIEGTERLVQRIDPSRLAREEQENYRTIRSFLLKAREALSSRDVQRALTLAEKAYLLADEMSSKVGR